MKRRKRESQNKHHAVSVAPDHEKLPWPGLKAKDHLSRVVTRAVKEAKEEMETAVWAKNQLARVLDHVPPDTVLTLVLCEINRRGNRGVLKSKHLKPRPFRGNSGS